MDQANLQTHSNMSTPDPEINGKYRNAKRILSLMIILLNYGISPLKF